MMTGAMGRQGCSSEADVIDRDYFNTHTLSVTSETVLCSTISQTQDFLKCKTAKVHMIPWTG
jgi:hypothetical protein